MIKKFLIVIALVIISALSFFLVKDNQNLKVETPATQIAKLIEKPLEKYTYEKLSEAQFAPSQITFGETLKDGEDFTSQIFYFYVEDLSGDKTDKKVSGLANIPKTPGVYPVIIMFRGYVDQEIYTTGTGTKRSGEVFAQNNFITLAPDFLGYGQSDKPSENPVEERFQTYTTSLTLLSSLKNLNAGLESINHEAKADPDKIALWGHSNGGQIALTLLEITGGTFPTVLWAPVSKPFPYSVLYYTDEFDDHGKALRRVIAQFEKDYDIENYSPTNFLDKINAPLQLHQGTTDDAVPLEWSDQLFEELKRLNKEVSYFTYPGDNHNFGNGSWTTVVNRNIAFFKEELEN